MTTCSPQDYYLYFEASTSPEEVRAVLTARFGIDAEAVFTGTEAAFERRCRTDITRATYPPIRIYQDPGRPDDFPVRFEASGCISAAVGGLAPLELAGILCRDLAARCLLEGGPIELGRWLLVGRGGTEYAQAVIDDECAVCHGCDDCDIWGGWCKCDADGGCFEGRVLKGLYCPMASAPQCAVVALDEDYTGPSPESGSLDLPDGTRFDHSMASTIWLHAVEEAVVVARFDSDDGLPLVLTRAPVGGHYAMVGVEKLRDGRRWIDIAAELFLEPATGRLVKSQPVNRTKLWRPDQIDSWTRIARTLLAGPTASRSTKRPAHEIGSDGGRA